MELALTQVHFFPDFLHSDHFKQQAVLIMAHVIRSELAPRPGDFNWLQLRRLTYVDGWCALPISVHVASLMR